MSKFKIGDKVEIPQTRMGSNNTLLKTKYSYAVVSYIYHCNIGVSEVENYERHKGNYGISFNSHELKKWKGDPMSLKSRIEALENGWDKDGDEILEELLYERQYYFSVLQCQDESGHIGIFNRSSANWKFYTDEVKKFAFNSQCEKMQAFKDALLWLLDKSGLEGHKKGDKIKIEVDGKTYQAKILEEL